MNVGIDIDGVLINFEEKVRYRAEMYNIIERKNSKVINTDTYKIEDTYGWSKEEWNEFSKKYLIEATIESDIMTGAKEVINLLKKEGHKLIIISSRGYEGEEMITIVEDKLKKENLIFDKYYWKVKDKLEIIEKENIDIMIDDNSNICKKISDKKVQTLYFRNIYGVELPQNDYLTQIRNWGEVYRFIK